MGLSVLSRTAFETPDGDEGTLLVLQDGENEPFHMNSYSKRTFQSADGTAVTFSRGDIVMAPHRDAPDGLMEMAQVMAIKDHWVEIAFSTEEREQGPWHMHYPARPNDVIKFDTI